LSVLADLLEDLQPGYADWDIGVVGPSVETLRGTILGHAPSEIDFGATAQALLIFAGKWAPDRDRPKLI
jgi:hypothetical protein